jgi:hypothetical protein
MPLEFVLAYEGNLAERSTIDFYDVSHALAGFQRSLALTTHLILNDEVITQAPSLKNAQILLRPPETGSWKAVATIVGVAFDTHKGRIYVPTEGRPVPFQLSESARNSRVIASIVRSLAANATSRNQREADIVCVGFRNVSKSGRLKSYRIVDVDPE